MKKIQYSLKFYDHKQQRSSEHKIYLDSDIPYYKMLHQLIDSLAGFNFELDSNNLNAVIIGGANPKENYILVERVIDGK